MQANDTWKTIARLIVGAFDVDIQHWMGKSFVRLRETPTGASFADWAEQNHFAFETLLRGTSALARQLPKDDNLLVETLYTQLARLPVEVERAVKDGTPNLVSSGTKDEEGFLRKYDDAVKDLSEEDLAKVVRLEGHRVREWVKSPGRVRPHLLAKWAEEDAQKRERTERSRAARSESIEAATGAVRGFREKLQQRAAERQAKETRPSLFRRLK